MDAAPDIRIRALAHGEDGPLRAVFAGMSERSRYQRFHTAVPRLTSPMQRLLTDVDGRRHVALVAETAGADGWTPVGLGRVIATGDGVAEVAFEVVDAWHGRGVGRRLLTALRHRAADLGHRRIVALVLAENRRAAALMRSVFPEITARRLGPVVELTAPVPDPALAIAAPAAGTALAA